MKPLLFILAFILLAQVAYGQKKKTYQRDEMLFEKGLLLQRVVDEVLPANSPPGDKDSLREEFESDTKETILESALEYYQELIDSFPKSNLLFRALNNKGYIELDLDERKQAKKTFLKIINSQADDKEKGGVGSGIMGEPYANYKNRAAKALAGICITDSAYNEALGFLELTKKFPYRHFCGNEFAADEIYMATMYGKCYIGKKNYPAAYAALLPIIMPNGLAGNSQLVHLAYEALLVNYSKADLKKHFEKAVAECKIENGDPVQGISSSYSINFLGTKIQENLPYAVELTDNGAEKETAIRKALLGCEFYTLLKD